MLNKRRDFLSRFKIDLCVLEGGKQTELHRCPTKNIDAIKFNMKHQTIVLTVLALLMGTLISGCFAAGAGSQVAQTAKFSKKAKDWLFAADHDGKNPDGSTFVPDN